MKRHIYVSLEETLRMTGLTLEQLKTIADEYGLYTTVKAKVLMIDILDLFHTIKAMNYLQLRQFTRIMRLSTFILSNRAPKS